ncbi:hypothetical protein RRG08_039090 [Elysia crispata]|uniref:Uncharacterized protein n=1 Tax=Elysia crispata TaxID=231223 RepID=A0AAE0YHZ1_9GAST|nr:hypothetical protein RRG08_039090 [Elysia crispata]
MRTHPHCWHNLIVLSHRFTWTARLGDSQDLAHLLVDCVIAWNESDLPTEFEELRTTSEIWLLLAAVNVFLCLCHGVYEAAQTTIEAETREAKHTDLEIERTDDEKERKTFVIFVGFEQVGRGSQVLVSLPLPSKRSGLTVSSRENKHCARFASLPKLKQINLQLVLPVNWRAEVAQWCQPGNPRAVEQDSMGSTTRPLATHTAVSCGWEDHNRHSRVGFDDDIFVVNCVLPCETDGVARCGILYRPRFSLDGIMVDTLGESHDFSTGVHVIKEPRGDLVPNRLAQPVERS